VFSRPIIIHSLAQARAAAEAAAALAVPLTLQSATGAGAYAGIGWFERLMAATRAEFPQVAITAVLDCGNAAEAVMAALRWLQKPGRTPILLCFTGDASMAERLEGMAREIDVDLMRESNPGLDLRSAADPLSACRAWLSQPATASV
jgi:hypothetical protein